MVLQVDQRWSHGQRHVNDHLNTKWSLSETILLGVLYITHPSIRAYENGPAHYDTFQRLSPSNNKLVTDSVKTLHVSVTNLANYGSLKFHNFLMVTCNNTKLCTIFTKRLINITCKHMNIDVTVSNLQSFE